MIPRRVLSLHAVMLLSCVDAAREDDTEVVMGQAVGPLGEGPPWEGLLSSDCDRDWRDAEIVDWDEPIPWAGTPRTEVEARAELAYTNVQWGARWVAEQPRIAGIVGVDLSVTPHPTLLPVHAFPLAGAPNHCADAFFVVPVVVEARAAGVRLTATDDGTGDPAWLEDLNLPWNSLVSQLKIYPGGTSFSLSASGLSGTLDIDPALLEELSEDLSPDLRAQGWAVRGVGLGVGGLDDEAHVSLTTIANGAEGGGRLTVLRGRGRAEVAP